MKFLGLSFLLFAYFFVREFNAQDNNIGIMPAGIYSYNCKEDQIQDDVPPFLLICVLDTERNCAANVSAPFLYWLQCEAGFKFDTMRPRACTTGEYERCNITCSGDPARVIYRPLYHPDQKIGLYPKIFDEIRNVPLNYLKAYVKMLRKTFTSPYYSSQYDYRWKKEDE